MQNPDVTGVTTLLSLAVVTSLSLDSAAPTGPAALRAVLQGAFAAGRLPNDFELDAGWREEGVRYRTLRIWGDGVAIRDESVQLRLDARARLALARTLLESGLTEMPAAGAPGSARDPDPNQGIRIRTRIRVTAGGAAHDVLRTIRDAPSPELDALVRALVALCTPAAERGVTAANLEDALEKMRAGLVAPQALRVTFQVLEEKTAASGARVGWVLHVRGRDAQVRRLGAPEGPTVERRLAERERRALVKALGRARLSEGPPVLRSERYEDLTVSALGHERALQARSFAGPPPPREAQKRYEALRRLLTRIVEATR